MEIIASATDSYLAFLLKYPIPNIWVVLLLGMARITPAIAFAPFFGGKMLPDPIKLGFSAAVTFIFLPFLASHYTHPITVDLHYWLLLAKEALVGSILGFFISIPFYYAQAAGSLIDHQRGSQSLQVMDPSTQIQTSPTGTLYNNLLLVIFFYVGGPLLYFDALFTSYQILPFDQFLPPQFFSADHPIWIATLDLATTVVRLALQLSAPSVIAMLLSDLFIGIANRMAPQVQISFLLWSLKAFVGIAMLWAAWWFVVKQLEIESQTWIKFFTKIVERL